MKYGAHAKRTATVATRGAKARFTRYSVIKGSNVHSERVTNTTSKAVRIPIHITAVGSSGGDASSALVPRTPAMITGMVIGYNRIGSSTSRERARTSMAANKVPTQANPVVPVTSSAT